MREGWRIEKFGGICDLKKGRKPRLTNTKEPNVNPYLVAKYLRGAEPTDFAFIEDKNSIPVTADEIIIICDGSNSGETFIGFDGILSSTMAKIVHGNNIETKFLIYFLELMFEKFNSSKTGSAIPHLDLNALRNQVLPVPPLPEQRRIVAILDEAFEGIAIAKANAEKNLQNAREVFASHLNAVFSQRGEGWVDRRLGDVAMEFGRGKSKHRPRNDPKLYGGNFPFIQTGDVRNSSHLITSYDQTYNDAGLAQSKLWPKGTLCITIAANIAETGILDFDACFPDSIIGLVANEKISTNKYIEYLLTSFKSRLQLLGKGSAQDNINLATFESQYFPFPPLSSQKEIVSIFDDLHEETQHLEFIYQQKLVALDELKQSLLHQAFNGDL
ncbi:restriction endonuclease subunit S [Acidithiobacillus sulfurivorans]|uniref:Restriction endonuclease subunit S n=1 Tax=Acidithiobacillus sulfurivorans TaxID=1958756 RepID=A0ABS5ZYX7_9PROT|nr:restriction endonuclease subunit S [Acidithiobacillus sulfurivorans]